MIEALKKFKLIEGQDFHILAVGHPVGFREKKRKISVRLGAPMHSNGNDRAKGDEIVRRVLEQDKEAFKFVMPGYNKRPYADRKFCVHETCAARLAQALISGDKQTNIVGADRVVEKLVNIGVRRLP